MRVFFVCMGSALRVYHKLSQILCENTNCEMISFSVTDKVFSQKYLDEFGPIDVNGEIIKEWEIVQKGRIRQTSPEEISVWENRLGIPSLWPAIVADRRTYMGRMCKSRQDYKPYFSFKEMQGIAIEAAETYWNAFQRQKPQVVVGFSPATFEALIIYWISKALGIPYMTIRSTKIGNYVKFGQDPLDKNHDSIQLRYQEYYQGEETECLDIAKHYFTEAISKGLEYEGVLVQKQGPTFVQALGEFLIRGPWSVVQEVRSILLDKGFDTHRPPILATTWESTLGNYFRKLASINVIKPVLIPLSSLAENGVPYYFYPLHAEPEIATSVFARYHMNQIEVIRNIAQSLPMGAILLVKEHPRSWGWRKPGYYKKLAEIPNIRFVRTETPTHLIISHAKAVIILVGFIGLEAAFQKVPVIALENSIISLLPDNMVRIVSNMEMFSQEVISLTEDYQWDPKALISLIAALMHESVPIDLWSTLLKKGNRKRGTGAEEIARDVEQQYLELANYFLKKATELIKHNGV
jgi:hypothetical protein